MNPVESLTSTTRFGCEIIEAETLAIFDQATGAWWTVTRWHAGCCGSTGTNGCTVPGDGWCGRAADVARADEPGMTGQLHIDDVDLYAVQIVATNPTPPGVGGLPAAGTGMPAAEGVTGSSGVVGPVTPSPDPGDGAR